MIAKDLPDYLPILEQWYGQEMADMHGRLPEEGRGLLLGCPIWGQRYIERFRLYCLPSMLAKANRQALIGARLVIYTDRPSYPALWELFRGFARATGIDPILRQIPAPVMAGIHGQAKGDAVDNKYWALGVAGQLALQMAGHVGMGYHMLMPDHVYGPTYFENLLRLSTTHSAIAQPGISALIDKACHDALYAHRQADGSLAIPDRELGGIGWDHMHPQTRANMILKGDLPDNLPLAHLWIWRGVDRGYLSACHMNAAYLGPDHCARAPSRIPATIDAELPAFFPAEFHVPTADDGLAYIELSDDSKPADERRGNRDQFVSAACEKVAYGDEWTPYAERLYELPLPVDDGGFPEEEVRRQHAWLLAQMRDERPTPKARAAYRFIQSLRFRR